MKYDWHMHSKQLEQAENSLRAADICEKNKATIFAFKRQLVVEGVGNARIVKYLWILKKCAMIFGKDFDKITKDDVMDFVEVIETHNYSEWTKHDYKVLFRRFYKWFRDSEVYPEEVRWMKVKIRKDRQKLPSEGDLLTEEDIQAALNCCNTLRDKALIFCLWESGCRIGEIATLRVKDIIFDTYGAVFTVTGKTGQRKIRIVQASPSLANWFSVHPARDNREAFVWVNLAGNTKGQLMKYATICKMLRNLFEKAGVKKKCNPHIFRHSRATNLANHLTEFQMNQYFGWVQGSNMPSTYVHLSGKEIENTLLHINGIKSETGHEKPLFTPIQCPRCDLINQHDSKFCGKCGMMLDLKEGLEIETKQREEKDARTQTDLVMNMLMKDPEVLAVIKQKLEQMGGAT